MKEIRYTLLSEGSSDKALLPILNWLLQIHLPGYAIQSEWADLSRFPKPPKTLEKRVSASLKYYPCDVLFIHRDADNQGQAQRRNEINEAIERANLAKGISTICVIPVRMTEAWLLSDESAIRVAADSPKGHQTLDLPHLKSIENIADPKELLYTMLRQASQVSGRRLKRFNQRLSSRVQRISEMTQDFSPLRELEAFGALELSIQDFVKAEFSTDNSGNL